MPEAPLIIHGGQAVPPWEVEQVLLSHLAVAEVAVVGVPDRYLGQVVAAAVLLSAPLPSPAADLARYCEARLARYKVPSRWLFTSALPRTAAGEPRRAMLRARLTVTPGPAGPAWTATSPASAHGSAAGRAAVDPADRFRPRPAIEDLRVPRQLRRSWALDDLDFP